ncbi:MAG: type 4a pilus biogenesis protein PilO [Candidatus Yanofskybacteria bacterium]|nr:type 4a pilus biogenesis protein PilO [Candidatus Yanofskybacteria bacterium]
MNYKKLIGSGLIALGIIFLPILVVPEYRAVSAIKSAIQQKKAAFDKKKVLMDKIDTLRIQTKERRADLEKLATILPESRKTQEVVVNIEEMSKEAGVELKTLKTAIVQQGRAGVSGTGAMQIEISSSGQYRSLLDFIKSIEKNLRILDVQEFTLSLDSSAASVGGLTFAAKILTYFIEKPLTP